VESLRDGRWGLGKYVSAWGLKGKAQCVVPHTVLRLKSYFFSWTPFTGQKMGLFCFAEETQESGKDLLGKVVHRKYVPEKKPG